MKKLVLVFGALAVAGVFGACRPAGRPLFPHGEGPPGSMYGDLRVDVAARLGGSVRLVDSVGRAHGALPQRLEEAVPSRWLHDQFGNPLEYSTVGPAFTIRSAGRDGVHATADDILVTGRLGRSIPCELRIEDRISQYHRAPVCSDVPIVVLAKCPSAEFLSIAEFGRNARRNPVRATGERLVALARRVDGQGRAVGGLPTEWRVPSLKPEDVDAWGHPIQYTVTGHRFELRSVGADGIAGNDDDVVVTAELGGIIPCEFTHGGERFTCPEPVPQCPGAGEPRIGIEIPIPTSAAADRAG